MNYNELSKAIKNLPKNYNVKVIGKTKFNRNIFAVEKILSESFSTAIFVCSMHARENITTDLVVKMIRDGVFDVVSNFNLSFILMANPDGVDLSELGVERFPKNYRKRLIKMNDNSTDFSLWKANALGVDINNNFDANFGCNIHSSVPSKQGFIGRYAGSEKETQAIMNYTKIVCPFITISYHSKGEEIYFNFFQKGNLLERDTQIAKKFADSTGYLIKNVERSSSGGYKDWCVDKLKIPALTIEVGNDSWTHPIKQDKLLEIFNQNKNVAQDLIFAYNVYCKYLNFEE